MSVGQEAFKKIQSCFTNLKNDNDIFGQYAFTLKSMVNTFNARYCSSIIPESYNNRPFDPIFLNVFGNPCRLEHVELTTYVEREVEGEDEDKDGNKIMITEKKPELAPEFWFYSEVPHNISLANEEPSLFNYWSLPYNDKALIEENGNLKESVFNTQITEFVDTLLPVEGYKIERQDNTPYTYVKRTKKRGVVEELSGLYTLLGLKPEVRLALVPRLACPSAGNTQESGQYGKIKLNDQQKEVIRNFLFGPGDIKYFDRNVAKVGNGWKFSFDTRLAWIDKTDQLFVGSAVPIQLGEFMADPYGEEIDTLNIYGEKRVFFLDDNNAKKGASPIKNAPKQVDRGASPSVTHKKRKDVVDPEEEAEEEPKQPAKKPANTEIRSLRQLIKIVKGLTPDHFKNHYLELTNFLNTFNLIHCSEISPFKDHRIKPIYIQSGKAVLRLFNVRISSNTNNVIFFFSDVDGEVTSYPYGELPVTETNINAAIHDTVTPFAKYEIADNVSYTVDYSTSRLVYGKLQRYYYPPTFGVGEYNECRDTNHLYQYIELKHWFVESAYLPGKHVKPDGDKDTRISDDNNVAGIPSTRVKKGLLKAFLFSDDPKVDEVNLSLVLDDRVGWVDTFEVTEDVRSVLTEIEQSNNAMYKLIVPGGRVKSVAEVPDKDPELKEFLAKIPRVAEAMEKLESVEKLVKRLREEQTGLTDQILALTTQIDTLTSTNKDLTRETTRLEKTLVLVNTEYVGKFKYMLTMLQNSYATDTYISEEALDTLNIELDELSLVSEKEKKALELGSTTFFAEGIDVFARHEMYSQMIRENLFKGKYNVEVKLLGSKNGLHMNLKHINTYTDEVSNNLVYGAMSSKNTQQILHNGAMSNQLNKDASGTLSVRVMDEKNRLIKTREIPFANIPVNGHRYMIQSNDTRVFLTRVSDESDALKVKMLIIDV